MKTIINTDFTIPDTLKKYSGKVRDVLYLKNDLIVMIVTDRISAFDVILPRGIPFKGQVLNQISLKMFSQTKDIVPNWLISSPDPNVSVGVSCQPFKVEMVIRGYLSGHAARLYNSGKHSICGVKMPKGMNENDKFPKPIITPTTKSYSGHDEDISKESIIKNKILSENDYEQIENYTIKLYERGVKLAEEKNLILVDSKYEFGKKPNGEIVLIDEIHTPDSSRYFYKDEYKLRQFEKKPQKQLSKEFLRQWLIKNKFQGKKNQVIPQMDDLQVERISSRYIEVYEKIIGETFNRKDSHDINERIRLNIINFLKNHK
tara:strand:+ start:59330 stop:60280 length:951 start_codon:yes stop_codon:yes gene_type:complete